MLGFVLAQAAALFLAGIFLQATWHKLKPANRPYYQQLLASYDWLPLGRGLIPALVLALGAAELLLALSLLWPSSRALAALLAALLLALYFAVLAVQLIQGKRDADCGCAGPASGLQISPALLLRNGVLILLALSAYWVRPLAWQESAVAIALASLMVLAYVSAERLLANAQKINVLRQS
ncbi:MAG: hypothetical protein OIF38_13925 [Cellvibrionaceae bacterium]|nr:hypothetical protein [Cellvibrionaceae bacterium]